MKKQANYQKYKNEFDINPEELCDYIGESYTQALSVFQKFSEEIYSIKFLIDKIPPITSSQHPRPMPEAKQKRSIHLLMNGQNKSTWIKVRTIRALHFPELTFILAIDEQSLHRTDRFLFLAVAFPEDSAVVGKWKTDSLLGTTFAVFNPFKRTQKISENYYIITRIQNLTPLTLGNWRVSSESLKQQANVEFKSKMFVLAIYRYQLGPAVISNPTLRKQRAIFYSNTSACFYEMRLYSAALKYSQLSIQVDPTYVKGFYRKLNNLLQLQMYKIVPHCLLKLSTKIAKEEYELQNAKYTSYLGNQIGIYNWKEIVTSANLHCFSQYASEKLLFQKHGNSYFAHAIGEIEQYQLLVVSKPLMYNCLQNSLAEQCLDTFILQAQRYLSFQRTFYDDFRQLPCICHPEGMKNALEIFQEESQYKLSKRQISNKINWAVLKQRNLQRNDISNEIPFGVWKRMFSFKHQCIANCTYIHFKSGIFVFSSRKIKANQVLTLDFLSHLEIKMRPLTMQSKFLRKCSCQYCKFPWNKDIFGSADIQLFIPSLGHPKIKRQLLRLYINKFPHNWSEHTDESLSKALKLYLQEILREPYWEDLHHLTAMLRQCKDQQLKEKIRVVVKSGFQRYLKLQSNKAQQLLTLII